MAAASASNDILVDNWALYAAIAQPVFIVKQDGTVAYVNQAGTDILGYRQDLLLNQPLTHFLKPVYPQETEGNFMRPASDKQAAFFDGYLVTQLQSKLSCKVKASDMPSNDGLIVLSVTTLPQPDENDLCYRYAFDHSFLGVAITNADGLIINVNKKLCDIFGYSKAELLSQNIDRLIFDADCSGEAGFELGAQNTGPLKRIEKKCIDKSGKIIWTNVQIDNVGLADTNTFYCVVQIEDITEKKRLEKLVANEQRQFEERFLAAPVSMCILRGPEHVFESANTLYLKLSGRNNIIGKKVRDVFPEAEGQGIFETMDQVFEAGEIYTVNERRIQLKLDNEQDLSEIYLNFMFQPYRDADGNVDGIFFFGVDITEQVTARKQVENSERRYRQIVEMAHEGIWLLNQNNKTTFANRKLAEILEVQTHEMIDKDFLHFVAHEMKEAASAVLQGHRQFTYNSTELLLKSNAGKTIWATIHSNSVVDQRGDFQGCLLMVNDITEKKKSTNELIKLSLIAKHTVNVVYIINIQGKIEWINDSFTRVTGYRFDEVNAKDSEQFLYGDLTDRTVIAHITAAREDFLPYECELTKYTKSGSTFFVRHHGQPIFSNDGKLSHFFVLETDVTDLHTAYEKLKARESEVRSFALQLNNILEGERLRIAREIHDELGQQLTVLKMLLTSMATEENLSRGARKIIIDMKQSVDAARSSIRNLATELRPGIIDTLGLAPSIEWLGKTFEAKSKIKCMLTIHVSEQDFEEKISMTFFRICQEALTNIMKHSAATMVSIQMLQSPNTLSLKIADNGKGIGDEKLKNPFSLGLLGMRERAKLINAHFAIESSPSGTTLYLIYKLNGQ
jgi:PAS domain S-box-containing protein